MSDIIKTLKDAHKRMDIALSVLAKEIDQFAEGNSLDYTLVESVIEYLRRATALNHHEVEDEIYRRIAAKDASSADLISNTHIDHQKLAFLGNALVEAVENVESDSELPRYWLVSVAKEYLNAHILHMRNEEKSLFPLALKTLTVADWQEISAMLDEKAALDFIQLEVDELEDLHRDIRNWREAPYVVM
ncbi:hemerythrin domain-containing protein [Sneathiella limimaris]|uniref:hemerythrin domain-containing protein n=1 Tax=Sneathiella limimaris TaxID=1964213 RepID=UPI00146B5E64|nr:hemerythrin domain-containing protein [Sneathiella limimaris]